MKVNCTFQVEINGQTFDMIREQAEELYKALKNALGYADKPINPQRVREIGPNNERDKGFPWSNKEVYPLPQVWCQHDGATKSENIVSFSSFWDKK